MLEALIQDVRLAGRALRNERGFVFISTAVLALGICAVTTQFSMVHAFLLRGVPADDPEQLVRLTLRDPSWPTERSSSPSPADLADWSTQQTSFAGVACYYTNGSFIVVRNSSAERMDGSHVTPNFLSLLRVKPALGRDFTEADDRPEADRVTIISEAMWRNDFGGDPQVLGRAFRVNGRLATVVGVMPGHFQFTRDRLWIPIHNEYPIGPNGHGLGNTRVFARLRPGVSIEQAASEMSAIAQRLAREFPDTNRRFTQVRVEPLLNQFVDRETRALLIMMLAAVAVVLGIACINVTNLQLARSIAGGRTLAVRTALGASRSRLIRQIVTECLVLVSIGSTAGVLLSFWTTAILERLVRAASQSTVIQPPPWLKFEINAPVLAFTLGAATVSVLLAGLVPALFASRTNPADALRDGSRSHTGHVVNRLSGLLVTAQIALTCALLVASLVLVRTIVNRQRQSLGYDGNALLVARMNLETEYSSHDQLRAFYPQLLAAFRSAPGITHAALTSRRNVVDVNVNDVEIEGGPASAQDQHARATFEVISDGYFDALGLRPLRGREFTPNDGPDSQPVVLVNAQFEQKYFPATDPVGHHVRLDPRLPWTTIVGVVPDTLMQGPVDTGTADGAGVFMPALVAAPAYISVIAKGHVPPEQLFEPLRRAAARLNPNVALYFPRTPQRTFEDALLASRIIAGMFSIFACAALVLATLGLYGVVSLAVNQRMPEFGIRTALGARKDDLIRLVLRQGAGQFAIGVAIGLAITLWLVRIGGSLLSSFLFRIDPRDPIVIAAAITALAIATVVACLAPARRAAKVDPIAVLRGN